jgi:hypothetical protein
MDRQEGQSPYVVGYAALSFVALSLVTLLHRQEPDAATPPTGRVRTLLRYSAMAGSQSLLQGALLFSLPFYVQAAAFTVPQCLFFAAFALCTVISLWEPWAARCLLHPLRGPALQAFASFAAWNVALPMLGVSHRVAWWGSGLALTIAAPLWIHLHGFRHPNKREILAASASLPLLLALFGTALLPAAPLKVGELGIGTGVVARKLVGKAKRMEEVPEELYCLSAIFEPRALDEDVLHVWTQNGEEMARIVLHVKGGRRRGFRTWSHVPLHPQARGTFRCDVTTLRGQVLATTSTRL